MDSTDLKNSCIGELAAEVLMVITSFIITINALYIFREVHTNGKTHDHDAGYLLSAAFAIFLPLLSYLFSQSKHQNHEGRAQVILIWMVLSEIIRMRDDAIFGWKLQNSADQLVRLAWVAYCVYSYTPLNGLRTSLLILCGISLVREILKWFTFKKAEDSPLIGQNPKLIHNYVKRIMIQDDLNNTASMNNYMSSCEYIVMGEESHEHDDCQNGYLLGKKKPDSEGILTIGRVFQLNSSSDEAFTRVHPNWRDNCLSLALAKMLRRRFDKLPLDEAGSTKAYQFVRKGLIDYVGNNRDIDTDQTERRNGVERVFSIIRDELKYVSEFLHTKVPIYHFFGWAHFFDSMGSVGMFGTGVYLIYKVCKNSSAWLSLVAQNAYGHCFFHIFIRGSEVVKIFSTLDEAITILLYIACLHVQYKWVSTTMESIRWTNLERVRMYIKNPSEWIEWETQSRRSPIKALFNPKLRPSVVVKCKVLFQDNLQNFKAAFLSLREFRKEMADREPRMHNSIFDKFNRSILLHKWLRFAIKTIRILTMRSAEPTMSHSTDVKEAILMSLKQSEGQLSHRVINNLNWPFQLNGSNTEAILVSHIATTLFHHKSPSSAPTSGPSEKNRQVAIGLSNYCHYLVRSLPQLLPDEAYWTEKMYKRVKQEIKGMGKSCCQRLSTNELCERVLNGTCNKNSVVERGKMIAEELWSSQDKEQMWKMLAEFWAQMMLFIAPSDNIEGHEKILDQGELITEIWALLTHAGILARPKHTEHPC